MVSGSGLGFKGLGTQCEVLQCKTLGVVKWNVGGSLVGTSFRHMMLLAHKNEKAIIVQLLVRVSVLVSDKVLSLDLCGRAGNARYRGARCFAHNVLTTARPYP